MEIQFIDGSKKSFEENVQVLDILKDMSSSLRKNAVVAKVNDKLVDLSTVLKENDVVEIIEKESEVGLEVLNHSTAHLLAHAIKRLYPHAKFFVGPVIEDGFYYDMDLGDSIISESDLPIIEKEMSNIMKENVTISRHEFTREEALEKFKDDEYKVDLINNLDEDQILSFYSQGEFIDLCRGPHLVKTGMIQNFKLLKVSGAYYKGDSNNKVLQRIYGISFFNKQELKDYLFMIEEAKKRDNRKLGKELKLFMMSDFGPGFPFFLPNGMILRKTLENFWYDEHTKEDYKFIQTPIMLNKDLWLKSGHWDNYKENMYTSTIDDHDFAIKPMNCPGGMLVYANEMHSYKDLPLRVGELGLVHRHEASGALSGLFRVRSFTQDDAHIFMMESQIEEEVKRLLDFIDRIYRIFGLTYTIELSTRPVDHFIGDVKNWDIAEAALAKACLNAGKTYVLNEGDGAFYGPKLDIHIKDSLKRTWQCGTIQLDMNLPERFDLSYIDSSGEKKRPVMLHRVIFGSMERFLGILIEHYAGAFPTWLAPEQVRLLTVNNDAHEEYAAKINQEFKNLGIRTTLDSREEKLGYKIREAQTFKVPYSIVIGDNEMENDLVTYRKYGQKEQVTVSKKEFIEMVLDEIKNKTNNL